MPESLFLKKDSGTFVFLRILRIFLRIPAKNTFFYRTPPVAVSDQSLRFLITHYLFPEFFK